VTGALIAIVIIIWAGVVNVVRMQNDYALPQVLPFCNGGLPGVLDFVGCAVLLAFFSLLWTILSLPRKTKEEKRRFRHSWWLIPLSLVLADYIRRNIKPSVHWRSLLDQFHVPDPERFSQLCVLIATCVAILAIAYIWHTR
jgi:hypothetical protein